MCFSVFQNFKPFSWYCECLVFIFFCHPEQSLTYLPNNLFVVSRCIKLNKSPFTNWRSTVQLLSEKIWYKISWPTLINRAQPHCITDPNKFLLISKKFSSRGTFLSNFSSLGLNISNWKGTLWGSLSVSEIRV